MALVRLPSGDMWDSDKMLAERPSNVDSLEDMPEPSAEITEEMLQGFVACPWCGQKPKDMVKHVKENHDQEIAQDVVEARASRRKWVGRSSEARKEVVGLDE